MVTLKDALAYFEAGFSLVPIVPSGKKPYRDLLPKVAGTKSWKPAQVERATEGEIRWWFEQADELNLAVACGAVSGGLVVIDFDTDADLTYGRWRELTRPLSDHLPLVRTGKGRHVYLRYQGEGRNVQLAKTKEGSILIESRGEGGLCMLPPSLHPSGQSYFWIKGNAAQIPQVNHRQYLRLMGAAAALHEGEDEVYVPRPLPKRNPQKSALSGEQAQARLVAYAQGVLRGESNRVAQTAEGGRNQMLNRAAFVLGRYAAAELLTESEIWLALEDAANVNGAIADDGINAFERTVRGGFTAGMAQPINRDELLQKL